MTFEEVIGTIDANQLFRPGEGRDRLFQCRPRRESIVSSADKQFGFNAGLKSFVVIEPAFDGCNREPKPNESSHAWVLTSSLQANRRAEGKSGENERQMKFSIQP